MAKYLVIVESPAKVKTIKKFLGSNYEVVASQGHVRDLPKSQLGVDPSNDYEPKYITIRGKGDLLASIRKEVKKADKVFLATDPDREGEAISWHLVEALKLEGKPYCRITFNEITNTAVKNSLKNPRGIDMDLVDAQQTRRILDRMVGYRISPLLWAKVKSGLSAGRVQSVALRIICDREKEIAEFIPQEYYTLDAAFAAGSGTSKLIAHFSKNDKLGKVNDKANLEKIMKELGGADFIVSDVKKSSKERKAPLPFTTSTMQQEASKALNFSIQKTMSVAQQLYEGVDVKGHGTLGLITYLRTDSTRVSDEAKVSAAAFIKENYGEEYQSAESRTAKVSATKVQDAHECIRPSDITLLPSDIKDSLSRDQFRLYQLIWKRFVASQMADAIYETITASIEAKGSVFNASESHPSFNGFMMIYTEAEEEDGKETDKGVGVNKLEKGQKLSFKAFDLKQHFTESAPHFTEASLVRTLEELGIGRPSTYSPTITTLIKRRYIAKDKRNLFVTELGEVVNSIMVDNFKSIVDENFTATMEGLLDQIEAGTVQWKSVVSNFYPDLDKSVIAAEASLEKVEIKDEETDVVCELCGRKMVIKDGAHGKFLACPGFPECRNTKSFVEKAGVACPKCGKDIIIRRSQKGRRFYGCEGHPDCDFISWAKPTGTFCPKCGSYMVEKGKKAACSNDECRFVMDLVETEV